MRFRLILLLAIHFCLSTTAFAQFPFDCINALQITSNDPIVANYDSVQGVVNEVVINTDCQVLTSNDFFMESAIWYFFRIDKAGKLVFEIIPDGITDDIDFALFQPGQLGCNNLMTIRCAASGENLGEPIDTICLGTTGLSLQSEDFFEEAGCQAGDDNFVAALDVVPGQEFYLAISAFDSDFNFQVVFGEEDLFDEVTSTKDIGESSFAIYPNPASDFITLKIDDAIPQQMTLTSISGKQFRISVDQNSQTANIREIPAGIYVVQVTLTDGRKLIEKFVKQ